VILHDVEVGATDFVNSSDPRLREYRRFDRESGCVTSLYRRKLPRVDTPETSKVIVAVTEDLARLREARVERMLNVLRFPWPISFAEYWNLDEQGRKGRILEIAHSGLLWIARREGWPPEPFQKARDAALDYDLVNEGFWLKGKRRGWPNPDRSLKASIYWTYDFEDARIYAVIYDKAGRELGRKLLTKVKPSDWFIYHALGDCKWPSRTRFVLTARNKKKAWSCSVSDLLKS